MIEQILRRSAIIPVVTLEDAADAVDLVRAFVRGGLRTVEITLRTPAALAAIHAIARDVPDVSVGAGTVRDVADLQRAADAGAAFAVSPGLTRELLEAGQRATIPYLPGAVTGSELMAGISLGYRCFKFFPARSSGGPDAIRVLSAPFPEVRFCPTGGITARDMKRYLEVPSVLCIAASWLAPPQALRTRDWTGIEALARDAAHRATQLSVANFRSGSRG